MAYRLSAFLREWVDAPLGERGWRRSGQDYFTVEPSGDAVNINFQRSDGSDADPQSSYAMVTGYGPASGIWIAGLCLAVLAAVTAENDLVSSDWAMPAAQALPRALAWAHKAGLTADRDAVAAALTAPANPLAEDVLFDFISALGIRDAEEPT